VSAEAAAARWAAAGAAYMPGQDPMRDNLRHLVNDLVKAVPKAKSPGERDEIILGALLQVWASAQAQQRLDTVAQANAAVLQFAESVRLALDKACQREVSAACALVAR
jgi:hypothetical protein